MVAERVCSAGSWRAQSDATVRFDWGLAGLNALAPSAAVVVIVDVLRFTTAVSVAVERGCVVVPSHWNDVEAADAARCRGVAVAAFREHGELSLSPTDLREMDVPDRLMLPSPNGSALTLAATGLGASNVLAGCLRNASATATRARELCSAAGDGGAVAVIAAAERWDDGSLRPCLEDLLGAGSVIDALGKMGRSPEADAAAATYRNARFTLHHDVAMCASGRELSGRAFDDDIATAAESDTSNVAAEFRYGAYVAVA